MYRIEYRVGSGDEGPDGRLKINTMVDICQRCCGAQLDNCEVTQEFYSRCNATTFLLFRQIDIKEYPVYGQELIIETGVFSKKKTYALRNTLIYDKATGKVLVACYAGGAAVNKESGKPEAYPKDLFERLETFDQYEDMDYLPRKVTEPKGIEGERMNEYPVYKYMIDCNRHVNNGRYIDVAMEYVPGETEIERIRIAYMKPAKEGDIFNPVRYIYENKILVSLRNQDEDVCANIEFTKRTL